MCKLLTVRAQQRQPRDERKGIVWIPGKNWILKQYVLTTVMSAAIQKNLG